MENAVDALKIAFSVIMFVMALSLGISSFSEANRAVKAIVTERDRAEDIVYEHVEPSENLTRIVGVDTIVPTMYQAYRENIAIYFFDRDGKTPLSLYYKTDAHSGERVKDSTGREIEINYIDASKESYGMIGDKTGNEVAIEHLDILLAGKINSYKEIYKNDKKYYENTYKRLYKKQLMYDSSTGGLYGFLKDKKFEERLGEYTQNEGASAITKRVITYILQ